MAYFIKQRGVIREGIDEKGLMIRAHGDDQIRYAQELRGHFALSVSGSLTVSACDPHWDIFGRFQSRLTARAASNTTTINEIMAWSIISSLAQRESTGTSVGDNAVLVLKATNR
jgi:hypothetical protein